MRQNKKTFFHFCICAGIFFLLAACSTIPPHGALQAPLLSANEYLQLASDATPPEKYRYELQAVNRLLQDKNRQEAQTILNNLANSPLTNDQRNRYQLFQAKLWLMSDKPQLALRILLPLQQGLLQPSDILLLHNLLAQAYLETNNIIASITQSDMTLPLIQDKEQRHQQLLATWAIVQNQPINTLLALQQNTTDPQTLGWLQLASIMQSDDDNTQQLANALLQWTTHFPHHPANELLPNNLSQYIHQTTKPAQQIALLVPLSGPMANSGTAIRNGFFAAYYYDKQKDQSAPTIKVIDTNNNQIVQNYQQAIAQGADFIVGPLSKANLTKLMDTVNFTVPTLALNSVPTTHAPNNLYQFGLSPLDEVTQIAKQAWAENLKHALIIAPNNAWGHNVANQLNTQWQTLGGQANGTLFFDSNHNLATSVRNLLNINLSAGRNQQLRRTIGVKTRVILRRRKDIDVIFLIAPPIQARQIQPLLNYYYAGNIPIYATSLVYAGYPNPQKDRDLNGVNFCDMPWVLDHDAQLPPDLMTIRQRIRSVWPNASKRHARLYALGVDAYQIIPHLNNMGLFTHLGTPAATGTLFLNQHNQLYRQLKWAEIRNGQPKT